MIHSFIIWNVKIFVSRSVRLQLYFYGVNYWKCSVGTMRKWEGTTANYMVELEPPNYVANERSQIRIYFRFKWWINESFKIKLKCFHYSFIVCLFGFDIGFVVVHFRINICELITFETTALFVLIIINV